MKSVGSRYLYVVLGRVQKIGSMSNSDLFTYLGAILGRWRSEGEEADEIGECVSGAQGVV